METADFSFVPSSKQGHRLLKDSENYFYSKISSNGSEKVRTFIHRFYIYIVYVH